MGILTEWITEWLKGLLIEGIMGNLEGPFDTVNTRVGEISVQVGTTPAAWNAGVFSLIRQLSETVILPIAGLILTFVATYELIQMILEKNNMHEFDVANIYKWVFKTTCAILILSNTFNIVMAVFDVSQSVIASAAGIVTGATNITPDMLADLKMTLETMELGSLLGLFLQSFLIKFTMLALNIFIFVIVYGRMILQCYILVPQVFRVGIAVINRFKFLERHDRSFARNANYAIRVWLRFALQLRMQNILQGLCAVMIVSLCKAVHIRFADFYLLIQNFLSHTGNQGFSNFNTFCESGCSDNGVFAYSVFFRDSVTGLGVVDQVRTLRT